MTTLRQFLGGLTCALCGWMLIACSSEEEAALTAEGKGLVRIGLSADTGFSTQTKAVDESEYENLENYTVQIWKDGRIAQDGDGNNCEWKGNALPQDGLIELDNGDYTLLAYTGESYKGIGATTPLQKVCMWKVVALSTSMRTKSRFPPSVSLNAHA